MNKVNISYFVYSMKYFKEHHNEDYDTVLDNKWVQKYMGTKDYSVGFDHTFFESTFKQFVLNEEEKALQMDEKMV